MPAALCALPSYWCRWHGETAYSGVALHVRREDFPGEPAYSHAAFDFENRIVCTELGRVTVASVYVPNGGKDFGAKIRFLTAMEEWIADEHARGRLLVVWASRRRLRSAIRARLYSGPSSGSGGSWSLIASEPRPARKA